MPINNLRLTEESKQDVIDRFNAGMSVSKIAESLKIPYYTVSRVLRSAGLGTTVVKKKSDSKAAAACSGVFAFFIGSEVVVLVPKSVLSGSGKISISFDKD